MSGYTQDDYTAREDSMRFVLKSNLNIVRAVEKIAVDGLASSNEMKGMFKNLATKLEVRNLKETEIAFAKSLLRQHPNLIHQMFGVEAQTATTRAAERAARDAKDAADAAENVANTLAAGEVDPAADVPF